MRLKVPGVELFSAGRAEVLPDDVVWSAWDPLTRHYRRLLLHRGALAGVLLMGDCRNAQHSPIYWQRLRRPRGLAVQSIHYATAGCQDKTL